MFFNSEEEHVLKEIEVKLREDDSLLYKYAYDQDYGYADEDGYESRQKTLLFYAIENNWSKVIKRLLIEKNLDVNLGCIEERGPSYNLTFQEKISPLAQACYLGAEDIVKMLLNHPSMDFRSSHSCWNLVSHHVDRVYRSHQSFMTIANNQGYKKIIKLLKEAYCIRYGATNLVKNGVLLGNNIFYDQKEGPVHNCATFADQILQVGLKQSKSEWTLVPHSPSSFFTGVQSLERNDIESIENKMYPCKKEKEVENNCLIC